MNLRNAEQPGNVFIQIMCIVKSCQRFSIGTDAIRIVVLITKYTVCYEYQKERSQKNVMFFVKIPDV